MLYTAGIFRISSLGGSISSNPERIALRRWGREARLHRSFATKAGSLNVESLLQIKENQIPKLRNLIFFFFLIYRKMQESELTEVIPPISTSAIWGQYPAFLHPEFSQGSPAHLQWWLLLIMTVTSFVYWYDRKYLNSHSSGKSPITRDSCWRNQHRGMAGDWQFLIIV